MSNPNTNQARVLAAALAKKNIKLGHSEALDVLAALAGHRNHQSSPAAKPGAVSARALLARKEAIEREARLASQVQELVTLREMAAAFKEAGLTAGVLSVGRDDEHEIADALTPAPGQTVGETEENFRGLADVDLLCDIARRDGFDFDSFAAFELNLAQFEEEYVRPAEKALRDLNVILDL